MALMCLGGAAAHLGRLDRGGALHGAPDTHGGDEAEARKAVEADPHRRHGPDCLKRAGMLKMRVQKVKKARFFNDFQRLSKVSKRIFAFLDDFRLPANGRELPGL